MVVAKAANCEPLEVPVAEASTATIQSFVGFGEAAPVYQSAAAADPGARTSNKRQAAAKQEILARKETKTLYMTRPPDAEPQSQVLGFVRRIVGARSRTYEDICRVNGTLILGKRTVAQRD